MTGGPIAAAPSTRSDGGTAWRARAISWPRPADASLVLALEVRPPVAGEVAVDVVASVMSPGTERARFLGLPTARVAFPHHPGCMAAGVVRVGTSDLPPGTAVAVLSAAHQSLVVVPATKVHPMPPGVAFAEAALWHLALTVIHGLAAGGHRPGEPVTVVGAGLVGALTRRLALARGAPSCLALAASPARAWTTRPEPVTTFTIAGRPDRLSQHPSLVVDATGTPGGTAVAVAAAPSGGRVVVLGSPRADVALIPWMEVYDRNLTVIGAHVRNLRAVGADGRGLSRDAATSEFFAHLAGGRMGAADLLTHYQPEEAPNAYLRLAGDRAFVSAVFDWGRPMPQAAQPVPNR